MMSRTFVPGSINECPIDFEMGTILQLRPEYPRGMGERSMRQIVAPQDPVPDLVCPRWIAGVMGLILGRHYGRPQAVHASASESLFCSGCVWDRVRKPAADLPLRWICESGLASTALRLSLTWRNAP